MTIALFPSSSPPLSLSYTHTHTRQKRTRETRWEAKREQWVICVVLVVWRVDIVFGLLCHGEIKMSGQNGDQLHRSTLGIYTVSDKLSLNVNYNLT